MELWQYMLREMWICTNCGFVATGLYSFKDYCDNKPTHNFLRFNIYDYQDEPLTYRTSDIECARFVLINRFLDILEKNLKYDPDYLKLIDMAKRRLLEEVLNK